MQPYAAFEDQREDQPTRTLQSGQQSWPGTDCHYNRGDTFQTHFSRPGLGSHFYHGPGVAYGTHPESYAFASPLLAAQLSTAPFQASQFYHGIPSIPGHVE
jgi:hypothetical protein